MRLNKDNWKPFFIKDIFFIENGKGITQEEIEENPGTLAAVQSGEENNGILSKEILPARVGVSFPDAGIELYFAAGLGLGKQCSGKSANDFYTVVFVLVLGYGTPKRFA